MNLQKLKEVLKDFGSDVKIFYAKGERIKKLKSNEFPLLSDYEPIPDGTFERFLKNATKTLNNMYEKIFENEFEENCSTVYCAVYVRRHKKQEVIDKLKKLNLLLY